METKVCTECKKEKPLLEFHKRKYPNGSCGVRSNCRQCCKNYREKWRDANKVKIAEYYKNKYQENREEQLKIARDKRNAPGGKEKIRNTWLKSRYGITSEEHKLMYIDQNGQCAICGIPVSYNKIHTDHNHKMGNVRGLLCMNCNLRLSTVEDEVFLEDALKYLDRYNADR